MTVLFCLGCQRCENADMVTLVNGNQVCNTCPAWMLECEAKHMLKMPLIDRRAVLNNMAKKRDVSKLKEAMAEVHYLSLCTSTNCV